MTSGRCDRLAELPAGPSDVLEGARRAVLTTVDPDGGAHSVPVIFALHGEVLVTPIDRKPKSGKELVRLRNLKRDPRVTLLADHWSEDWSHLAWVMIRGKGYLQPGESSVAEVGSIIVRHPEHREVLEGSDVIRIEVERISWWTWT